MKRKKIRTVVSICAVLVVFLSAYVLLTEKGAVETAAWGLSFPKEGQAPSGPVTQAALDPYDARYLGDTAKKEICLTFDAGYENGCTAQILDTLRDHGVRATFFLVGNYLEQNPELVRRMAEEGHTVGNHTYHHRDMSAITDETVFREELESVERLYKEITGQELAKYYRPPQGVYSEENLKLAKTLGYRTVFWSLAYADWKNDDQPTKEQAFSKLLPRIHSGAIVLLHSTSKTNAAILDELLTKWEEAGYTFVTPDALWSETGT